MKRNTHVIVPAPRFTLLRGADQLSCYTFHTGTARHMFCSNCGICAFYRPRSNPQDYAVTLQCIDPGTVDGVTVRTIDGRNWEQAVAASAIQQQGSGD